MCFAYIIKFKKQLVSLSASALRNALRRGSASKARTVYLPCRQGGDDHKGDINGCLGVSQNAWEFTGGFVDTSHHLGIVSVRDMNQQ